MSISFRAAVLVVVSVRCLMPRMIVDASEALPPEPEKTACSTLRTEFFVHAPDLQKFRSNPVRMTWRLTWSLC